MADQAQCADQELTTANADLEKALADALRRYSQANSKENKDLPKDEVRQQAQYEARMRAALIASQKAWLRYRISACNSVSVMYDGGTITASAVRECKAALTHERVRFLHDYFGENR